MKKNKSEKIKKKSKAKNLIVTIVFMAIALFVTFLFIDNGGSAFKAMFASFKLNGHTAPSISIELATKSRTGIFKDSIIISNKDGVKAINKKGEDEWSIPMTLSSPMLLFTSKQIMVADKGGREVNVISSHSKVDSIKLQDSIILARINEGCYSVVVSEEKGYKGKVVVYKPDGMEVYKWYSVENYIIDVDISNDGKRMTVLTMDTSKDKVAGGVLFFYLNQESHYSATVIEDTLPVKIKYNKDNTLIAICDNKVLMFNKNGEKKWENDYAGRALKAYNIDSERMIVLALSEKPVTGLVSTSTVLETVEMNGNKNNIYNINDNIKSLDVQEDIIVINKKRDIIMLSKKGKEIAKVTLTKDIDEVQLFQNKSQVMVVSKKEVEIVDMLN